MHLVSCRKRRRTLPLLRCQCRALRLQRVCIFLCGLVSQAAADGRHRGVTLDYEWASGLRGGAVPQGSARLFAEPFACFSHAEPFACCGWQARAGDAAGSDGPRQIGSCGGVKRPARGMRPACVCFRSLRYYLRFMTRAPFLGRALRLQFLFLL